MQVIICAAGNSKRMGNITRKIPKPLLPINNTTLIENILNCIPGRLVNEVIVIVGYMEDKIKSKLGNNYNGIKIRYVTNHEYSTTNNMYSIYLTRNMINGPIIFVSADVLIQQSTFECVVSDLREDLILVDYSEKYFQEDDPVKVSIKGNAITSIDKNMNVESVDCVACGLYKLSSTSILEFLKYSKLFIDEDNVNYGYIEPIKQLVKTITIEPFDVKNQPWCDVDTPEEYEQVKEFAKRSNI